MNASELLSQARTGTAAMPLLMRVFCTGAMVASPLLLLALFVAPEYVRFNGVPLSRHELWGSGAAFVCIPFLLLATGAAWGLALRKPAARWTAVLVPVLPTVVGQFLPASEVAATLQDVGSLVSSCICAVLIYLCLFRIPAVKRYFSGERGASRSA